VAVRPAGKETTESEGLTATTPNEQECSTSTPTPIAKDDAHTDDLPALEEPTLEEVMAAEQANPAAVAEEGAEPAPEPVEVG
jgi:hypothetical protein